MGLVDHMNTLYNSSEGGGDMDDCVGRCCKIAFERPLFTARRIRGAYFHSALCYGPLGVCLSVCLSVRHNAVFCRNGGMDRADFRHGGYLGLMLHCAVRHVGYLRK